MNVVIAKKMNDWFLIREFKNTMNNSQKTKGREDNEKGHNYAETYYR